MKNVMPDISSFQSDDYEEMKIFNLITYKGHLRSCKPKVNKEVAVTGMAAYVWRMVAFTCSPIPQHHCMPVCAFIDLPYDKSDPNRHDNQRLLEKKLQSLADRIEACVPVQQRHGLMRWARVL